ncbi:MAG TPA: hypothetical protein VGF60_15215 [Xanthobacteraceae bacterium]
MKRSRARSPKPAGARRAGSARAASTPAPEGPILSSGSSLHELFEQQTRQLLDRADLDDEQKQRLLVAMSCPCCGAGAMSYTVKLRR